MYEAVTPMKIKIAIYTSYSEVSSTETKYTRQQNPIFSLNQ